jgi:hypothetical protein
MQASALPATPVRSYSERASAEPWTPHNGGPYTPSLHTTTEDPIELRADEEQKGQAREAEFGQNRDRFALNLAC